MSGIGAYPGSFNPPTIAHLAIAEAAAQHAVLERVDLIVSRVALGKGSVERPRFGDRIRVLEQMAATRPWLAVRVTEAQLLADLAEGYDVLIVGADKWAQVVDPAWYGSEAACDEALARLPRVVVAPRPPAVTSGQEVLTIADHHLLVSSTGARTGGRHWMATEAADFDAETGAWSDPERYDRWQSRQPP